MTSRLLIMLTLLGAPHFANAAGVTQVKGAKALLDLTGQEDAQVGDEFFSINAEGKKRSILKITQIKKGKAIAEVVKGKPEAGHDLLAKSSDRAMSRDVRPSDVGDDNSGVSQEYVKRIRKKYSGASWGLMGEFIQTSMTASFTRDAGNGARSVSAAMKGSTFGVLGYYDYPITPQFQLRGLSGLEQVSATGTLSSPDCGDGTSATCTFNVTYLSFYGAAKYNFSESATTRWWASGGYGFLLAMSKASNVISVGQISTNQVISLGVGLDWILSKSNYVPVSLDYGMFPSSATVKANMMVLRAGYAWTL